MHPSQRQVIHVVGLISVVILLATAALLVFAGGVVSNLLQDDLAAWLQQILGARYKPVLWAILGAAAVVAVGSAVIGFVWPRLRPDTSTSSTSPPSTDQISLTPRTRAYLLNSIETIWVKGRRNESLPAPGLIDLSFAPRPDAVTHIRGHEQHQFTVWQKDLAAAATVGAVFADAQQQLLILGEPGAGKSTVLYTVVEALIEVARNNLDAPVPIVFELSEWNDHRGSFRDWLVWRLRASGAIHNEQLARAMLSQNRIAAMLDGLDEIPDLGERARCVAAIEGFLQEQADMVPFALCCRTKDFEMLDRRMDVQRAVEVKPLSIDQIQDYLAGEYRLRGLRKAVRDEQALLNLAQFPLFLWLMTTTYADVPSAQIVADVQRGNLRSQVLQRYVDGGGAPTAAAVPRLRIPTPQLNNHLVWLARGMQAHTQQEFYIELLQPSWLGTRRQLRHWRIWCGLVGGLVFGLVVGLGGGLVVGLIFGMDAVIQHYVLRWLLKQSDALPLVQLIPMLEEAVDRRLLVRVGGGDRFLHRIVQEYYAEDLKPTRPVPPVLGPD